MIAILLAGIDGIVNKIDPVKEGFGPYDKNFLEDESVEKIHFLPRNLAEAIDALEADNEFLKRGNIFSDELLDQWMKVKREEVHSIGTMPHPFEYKMYFSL
jgi:glutamine synthetase